MFQSALPVNYEISVDQYDGLVVQTEGRKPCKPRTEVRENRYFEVENRSEVVLSFGALHPLNTESMLGA